MALDELMNTYIVKAADFAESIVFYAFDVTIAGQDFSLPFILLWLAAASVFFTVYLGFINLRYFGHAIDVVRGKFDKASDTGEISSFQALTTSLSGTVGLGNIAGVAVAVSAGGPGAVFWMAMMGLFGMTAKFAEATLGFKYRHHPDPHNKNHVLGGPMYYLKEGFAKRDQHYFGKFLAIAFAVFTVGGAIGAGNMFQANQAFQQVLTVTGGADSFLFERGWLFGIGLAVLVGLVILGGLQSIARVASRIVPFMGGLYLVSGLIVIAINYQAIPAGFVQIFSMALSPQAGLGAILGGLLIGVQRAAFSNEAGIGSAAIVHATAKTDEPVSQGFVGMLGPFIDTIVICMVTALVIVMSGVYQEGQGVEGVTLTSRAFESAIPWFPYVLAVTVFLFAYSTMIAWFYCGQQGLVYLTGERPMVIAGFKIFYCLCVVVGSAAALGDVIRLSDSMIFAMAVPNIIGLYLLAPELKEDLKKYLQKLESKKK